MTSNYKILLLNIRSMKSKFDEIETTVREHNPDILALIETWLSPNDEHLYNLNNYVAEFHSRGTRGGGLALYIRKDINYTLLTKITSREIETIKIELQHDRTAVTLLYKPPHVQYNIIKQFLQNDILNRKKNTYTNWGLQY